MDAELALGAEEMLGAGGADQLPGGFAGAREEGGERRRRGLQPLRRRIAREAEEPGRQAQEMPPADDERSLAIEQHARQPPEQAGRREGSDRAGLDHPGVA